MVSPMLVLAHRGANRLAPENTVPAMAQAVDLGADGVELDVHGTADGSLVVRHDADTPSGPIGRLTCDELRTVCPDVPTLAEVLDVCRGTLVNVEVKDPDPRALDALVTLLAAREDDSSPDDSSLDDVLVSAFDWTLAERVRAAAPQVPTGLLSFGVPPDEVLVTAVRGGHSAVHPDVWTLLTLDIAGFVTRGARPGRAGERVDGERRGAGRDAARRGCRRGHHRRQRPVPVRRQGKTTVRQSGA